MTHTRYFFISLFLVATATVIVTLSDYWATLNSLMVQAESYALNTANYLNRQLFIEGDPRAMLKDPSSFGSYRDSIKNIATSFNFTDIVIFNRDGIVLFSTDGDVIGQEGGNDERVTHALAGTASSDIVTSLYMVKSGGGSGRLSMIGTYGPIIDPESGLILGAYGLYQDYRPVKARLVSETHRSAAIYLVLMIVFMGLFYGYGRLTSRFMETHHHSLIKKLEERVEERTVELKRSRDRVSELLKRREEMFRNLMIADEYKKNFMGLVSHELRTPLTVIKGYLTMIRDGDLGPVYSGLLEAVNTCFHESTQLESIINNILELSQLERGLFDLTGEQFEVRELLNEAVDNLSFEVGDRKGDITIEVSREVSHFTSDRIKILQVLQQFLSNALKFSTAGSHITVKASPSHRGLLLSVSDEGVGIPRGQVNEIFNLFYQVDISTTRSYEGSGLGLAIVHKIGQILGGRAWVESEEGTGSVFYFEVPTMDLGQIEVSVPGNSVDLDSDPKPREVAPVSRSILLVDDDEDYLFLLRRILIDGGYTIEMCKDGLEGLNRIFGNSHPSLPSLIILDIRMPNINGIDFLKILRRNMATREIPVIVVSALGQETQIQEGMDAGANAYFVKPFDPETLLTRIDFLLGKKTLTRES